MDQPVVNEVTSADVLAEVGRLLTEYGSDFDRVHLMRVSAAEVVVRIYLTTDDAYDGYIVTAATLAGR
jgi:hypothetical protein